MDDKEREDAIHEYLSTKYTYLENNEGVYWYYGSSDEGLVFWVLYSPEEETISYMRISVPDLWRDYSLDMGKTVYQLMTEYGEPFWVDDEGWLYYLEENDYIDYYVYGFNATSQKVNKVYAYLYDNFDGQAILDELLRKFVYYEPGSAPSEGRYAFKNEEGSVGIVFYAWDGCIGYVDLRTSTSASSRTNQDWIPSREECSQKAQMIRNSR